ncbi:MAG: hypothetical protein GY765_09825 [bacterium]|nr:hypothetical protein [bacterium]
MKQRYTGTILLFLVLCLCRQTAAQRFPFKRYLQEERLKFRCLFQDSKGFLWIGSNRGIRRFDGTEFLRFRDKGAPYNETVTSISEDQQGNIWLGTLTNGVFCREGDMFRRYGTDDGLAGNNVHTIVRDTEGNLWFGTGEGLSRYDGRAFTTYTEKHGLPSNIIYSGTVDKEGRPWFGTDNGLCRFDNQGLTNYLPGVEISRLMTDSKGDLWYIVAADGAYRFRQGKVEPYIFYSVHLNPVHVSIPMGEPGILEKMGLAGRYHFHSAVTSILEDRYGTILFSQEAGVSFLEDGKFLSPFIETTKHLSNSETMLEDREGNIWSGSNNGLLCFYSLKTLSVTGVGKIISEPLQLNNEMVRAIIQDREGLYWCATDSGITYFSKNTEARYFTQKNGLIFDRVYDLLEDRYGYIWAATARGVSVYSKGGHHPHIKKTPKGTFFNFPIFKDRYRQLTRALAEDRNGTIWIGTAKGLTRFHEGKISDSGFFFPEIQVNCILADPDGNLWIGTDNGLYQGDDQSLQFSRRDGLPHHMIFTLTTDHKGRLWIGTGRGLSCRHKGVFTNYAGQQGLFAGECFSILEDRRHQLWIGTANGIKRFDGKQFIEYPMEREGIASSRWYPGACLMDRDGKLWFAGNKGVSRIDKKRDTPVREPFPLHITHVYVRDKEVQPAQLSHLPYNQNNLRFKFSALYFAHLDSIIYHYRLEGLEAHWIETKNNSVSYPYLPPGNYTFRVKAVNQEGLTCIKPARITFEITPSFFRTNRFRIPAILILLGIPVILVVWRYRRSRDKAELKTRNGQLVTAQRMELMGTLAAGVVHDLKNLLGIILSYTHMVPREPGDDTKNMPVKQITHTANTAIGMVRQILAFTRQQYDETMEVDLADLIDEFLELFEVRKPGNIEYLWKRPASPVCYSINPTRFQQVLMNLCINAVDAMPEGGILGFSLEICPARGLELKVSDTGEGVLPDMREKIFQPLVTTKAKGKGTGLGLFVVKQILEEYGGTISVESPPNGGAVFTITLPRER